MSLLYLAESPERQWRGNIPAWAEGPGKGRKKRGGLKARNIRTRRAAMCRAFSPENPTFHAVGAPEAMMLFSYLTRWVIR
jgi:hypothetical protein